MPGNIEPVSPVTYEQFLDWADEDTLAEWVDGQIIRREPESAPHQELLGFLGNVLRDYTEERDLGQVLLRGYPMKLEQSGREPDLLFIAKAHRRRMTQRYLDGPADIAVEIISPESEFTDRDTKFAEYEAGGVGEYWLLDQKERRADFFGLSVERRFERIKPDAAGIFWSVALPGFWLNVNWLWQTPLPNLRDILREWEQH
ncbi:MAG: Uma2 family endonuclease [Armatimonadota bacterium]|nr:Uma2 family endonuclease [Armatimonadota bacterium]